MSLATIRVADRVARRQSSLSPVTAGFFATRTLSLTVCRGRTLCFGSHCGWRERCAVEQAVDEDDEALEEEELADL